MLKAPCLLMIFGIGWLEVTVIMIIVSLLFGINRIPDLGSSLGKALRGFKEEISSLPEKSEK